MTQPGSPTQSSAGVGARSRRLGDLLARLGGADPDILGMARDTGRSRFVQMGLVLLSTAGLATLSMAFALATGLHLPWPMAVPAGLVWGFIILNLDRMLILNLDLRGGFWRVVAVVTPRVVIAALLGVVISTPLVLQVFQVEIQKQIAETQTKDETTLGTELGGTATGAALDKVRAEIGKDEGILRGELPPVDTPEVQAQAKYLQEAEDKLNTLRTASDQAYRRWQCELYGTSCEDASSVRGNGNLARAREQEYREKLAQTNSAQRDVDDLKAALDKARAAAGAQGEQALASAQEEARRALPELRQREAKLQADYNDRLDGRAGKIADNDGLLAQIIALNDLSAGKPEARLTHISLGLLFFMIELLPVLVKIMTGLGAPSLYERIREQVEIRRFDEAASEMRLSAAAARKDEDIEDDMLVRERDLGFKANARVAHEMEGVLEVALADWALQVQNTLHHAAQNHAAQNGAAQNGAAAPHAVPQQNTGPPSAGTSTSNGAAAAAPSTANGASNGAGGSVAQATIRSAFRLPDGGKL